MLVLNDQDALVDLADGVSVTEIAMAVHGEGRLRDDLIRVGCLISGQDSLMSMEKEKNIIYRKKIWKNKKDKWNSTLQRKFQKKISGIAPFKGNSKRINVFTEPLEKTIIDDDPTWTTIPSYSECKNGSLRVGVAIQNVPGKVVVIAKGQEVALVSAANQVPNMLAPKYVKPESEEGEKILADRVNPMPLRTLIE